MAIKTKGFNPRSLANLKPLRPGQSGNPKGRPSAGAALIEWINVYADQGLTETQLREIAKDLDTACIKRAAAECILRAIEFGDLADMEDYLDGTATIADLRRRGVNTEVIKKVKARTRTCRKKDGITETVIEREIQLHDRGGENFDRICDRTEGKPAQRIHRPDQTNHLRTVADGVAEANRLIAEYKEIFGTVDTN